MPDGTDLRSPTPTTNSLSGCLTWMDRALSTMTNSKRFCLPTSPRARSVSSFTCFRGQSIDQLAFDFECDWIRLYLGKRGGNHIVGFQEFAQLLKGFRGERVRQAFRFFDTDNDGFISPAEFQKIMVEVAGHKLSDSIIERLPTMSLMTPGQRISYSEVFAFHNSESIFRHQMLTLSHTRA